MKKWILVLGLFAAITSCYQIEDDNAVVFETKELTITATREAQETKTARQANGDVYWNPDDAISLFFRSGTNGGSKFTAQNAEAVPIAQFKGTIDVISGGGEDSGGEFWFWGIYPYSSENSCDGSSITTVIPHNQVGKAGTFADNTFITMARAKGLELGFYNICSGIKFTLTRDDIKQVRFAGNNSENIAGMIKAGWDEAGKPAIEEYINGKTEITVTAPENGTFEAGEEYYIVFPPVLFSNGFTLTLYTSDYKKASFVYENTRQFKRGIFVNISNLDERVVEWVDDIEYQLTVERDALIAIYNALDGDNWTYNENWCSDEPVGEWYGITTNSGGNVTQIDLSYNNLSGTIPAEIGSFPRLFFLRLEDNGISGSIPNTLFNLTNLGYLTIRSSHLNGIIPDSINGLKNLQDFSLHGESIDFPSDLSGLTGLRSLHLGYNHCSSYDFLGTLKYLDWLDIYYTELSIPDCIGDMTFLRYLSINNCVINGDIPATIGNLNNLEILDLRFNTASCSIPKELGNLTRLNTLYLYQSSFNGSLPKELGNLVNLDEFDIGYNNFSGKLPVEVASLPICKKMWPRFYDHTGIDISGVFFPAPDFDVKDLNGVRYTSEELYANHQLTVLFEWATWCPDSDYYTNILKGVFNKYDSSQVFILGYGEQDSLTELNDARQFVEDQEMPWPNVFWTYDYSTGIQENEIYRITVFPLVCVFDSNNKIVFNTYESNIDVLDTFISDYFDGESYYTSCDYSQNGESISLQQCSSGDGIDLVLMGDGFSDRQIADGTYDTVMRNAMNAFFSEEPYKSFKERFNVSYVNVVSATEGYEHSGQALGTGFGDGTYVYGNDNKVIEYAKNAVSEDKLDDALIIVMMNRDYYAGTCYMYNPPSGNYGRGLSIAYFPTSSDTDTFNGLVSHEAGGHGFAKLADEYAYEYMGAVPAVVVSTARSQEAWGWSKNVDFTSDPEQVKWSQFIEDSRYAAENIGCYEGAYTYWTGAWRPTEESIMNHNTGGFNAPSRYAIWYRINKLAYGDSWNGTYDDFVSYDAVNRSQAVVQRRQKHNCVERQLPPLAPPVVVGHSWRDAK